MDHCLRCAQPVQAWHATRPTFTPVGLCRRHLRLWLDRADDDPALADRFRTLVAGAHSGQAGAPRQRRPRPTLRYQIRRRYGRSKRLVPFDALRGAAVETSIHFERAGGGRIEARSYLLQVRFADGDEVAVAHDLRRDDDERQVLVAHWRMRRAVRRDLQRRSGPRPLQVWIRRAGR